MFSQWISNAYSFPGGSITIDRFYCFLFSMYANSTAFQAGRMFGQFCIYRGGSEIFLFNTIESGYIRNQTASRHIWYFRTQQNITFLSGDRLIFKLFLNVLAPGSFTFYYDSVSHRSYLTDPTETRYLFQTTNADGTKKLSTDYPAWTYGAQTYLVSGSRTNASWGIRVWNVTIAGVEQEITSGIPVAVVNRTANGGVSGQIGTWACPAANWDASSNCSLRVKWYGGFNITGSGSGYWQFLVNSTTPTPLGTNYINASTWTVTYYTKLSNLATNARLDFYWDGLEESLNFYPTRIVNIIYATADYQAPFYYNQNAITTTLQSATNYAYCNWTETGSVTSYIDMARFGHNNSGIFTWQVWQDTIYPYTTYNFSSVSFTNNATIGYVIAYRWQGNDTSGNLNDTMPFQYYTITSSVSWQNPIVWGCWFYRNWSTAIVRNNWFYRNWSSAITWQDYFYRNWSMAITWENWFYRNWSSPIIWLDDLILTIIIVPGWQPPIVWQFKIGINPNELAQAAVIGLIFIPILLILLAVILRRKR